MSAFGTADMRVTQCPLSGAKRTSPPAPQMSANDPKRALGDAAWVSHGRGVQILSSRFLLGNDVHYLPSSRIDYQDFVVL